MNCNKLKPKGKSFGNAGFYVGKSLWKKKITGSFMDFSATLNLNLNLFLFFLVDPL